MARCSTGVTDKIHHHPNRYCLVAIDSLEKNQIKQILGFVLLLVLLVRVFWKVQPRDQLPPGWTILAFSCSGVTHGMAAMGGPPVVLWVTAHRWSNKQTRAFLLSLFLLAAPLQLLLLYIASGGEVAGALLTGLAFAPVVAIGSTIGVRLGNLIATSTLRQIALRILFVTATVSILAPVMN